MSHYDNPDVDPWSEELLGTVFYNDEAFQATLQFDEPPPEEPTPEEPSSDEELPPGKWAK